MTRLTVGAKVTVHPNNPRYAANLGIGTIISDDKSNIPYFVRFNCGAEMWFRESSVLAAENEQKYRLILTQNPINRDNLFSGNYFLSAETVDISRLNSGICGSTGYTYNTDIRDLLAGAKGETNRLMEVRNYNFAYVLVSGMVLSIPFFAEQPAEITLGTKQLDTDKVYRLVRGVSCCTIPDRSLVRIIRQEPANYHGLGYHIEQINTNNREWISSDSVFELV